MHSQSNSDLAKNQSSPIRKRHKSAGSKPSNDQDVTSEQILDTLRNGNVTSTVTQSENDSNFESSKSDIHPETASESSAKDGSDENLNDSFSSRFATPIKEALTSSMDFFSPKSRVGSTLRSSLRIAKNFTKTSKYGMCLLVYNLKKLMALFSPAKDFPVVLPFTIRKRV